MVIPLTMDSDDDTCPITVTNHDVQINELLCFVSCKSRVMSILQISKLCCDFYANSAIQEAKDVLLGSISMPETDKRKSRRKTRVAETTMQDIITIFYEMKPRMMPTFVAKDLNNLPPLSMNNFDMAHIIEEMSEIKCKMSILQEAQEKSLAVHAVLCNDAQQHAQSTAETDGTGDRVSANPENRGPHPEVAVPQLEDAEPQPEVEGTAPKSPAVVFNITGDAVEHGMDGNDDDILNLAHIQGAMPPRGGQHRPSTPTGRRQPEPPQSPTNSMMSNTSYASLVRNGQLNNQPRRNGRELRYDNHQGNRKHNRNNATLGTGSRRRDDDVITGSGRNFDICSSGHQRRRSDPKYREVIGVFVSRLQRNTRAADIERHVSRVFGLRLKCDPVPTKFDTYTSYRIRASTCDTKTLLNSNKWPENVLVKEYYKVIY